jgi:hypothetical protein
MFELSNSYSPAVVGLGSELDVDATFSQLREVVEELTSPDSLAIWVATSRQLIRDVPNRYSIARVLNELSLKVVDERERRRTLLGKLSSQTPRPRCHPGERYATYVEGYHYEIGSAGGG